LPLSEKVRIEIFVPDLPEPIYNRLLDELGDELSYAFGGCTVISSAGKYRSDNGRIIADKINLLFTDAPFLWNEDRAVIERYAEEIRDSVQNALKNEEAILITVYPICHTE